MASLAHLSHHFAAASHGSVTSLARYNRYSRRSSFSLFNQPLIKLSYRSNPNPHQERNNKRSREMSRRNGKAPKVDLKLNLTRSRVPITEDSPRRSSSTMSLTSPPSSCISSDMSQDDLTQLGYFSSSPEAQSMVLAGCQRCLMYVMLSEDDPKCPKCRNTVLLEFMQEGNQTGSTSTSTKKTRKNC